MEFAAGLCLSLVATVDGRGAGVARKRRGRDEEATTKERRQRVEGGRRRSRSRSFAPVSDELQPCVGGEVRVLGDAACSLAVAFSSSCSRRTAAATERRGRGGW
jgi:hypothetical protein